MTTYQRNYRRLTRVLPILEGKAKTAARVSKSGAFMDLHYDYLGQESSKNRPEGSYRIALHHSYESNGDLVADPDMVLLVMPGEQMVEALTFQDSFGYQEVYDDDYTKIRPRTKAQLNQFLGQWLLNLHKQGHKIRSQTDEQG